MRQKNSKEMKGQKEMDRERQRQSSAKGWWCGKEMQREQEREMEIKTSIHAFAQQPEALTLCAAAGDISL